MSYPIIQTSDGTITATWWSNSASIKDRFQPGIVEVEWPDPEGILAIHAGGPKRQMILRLSKSDARKLASEIMRMTGVLCREQQEAKMAFGDMETIPCTAKAVADAKNAVSRMKITCWLSVRSTRFVSAKVGVTENSLHIKSMIAVAMNAVLHI